MRVLDFSAGGRGSEVNIQSDCPEWNLTKDPEGGGGKSCLKLAAEDLADDSEYGGRCLHCRREITEQGGVQWRRSVRRTCPHCGKAGW